MITSTNKCVFHEAGKNIQEVDDFLDSVKQQNYNKLKPREIQQPKQICEEIEIIEKRLLSKKNLGPDGSTAEFHWACKNQQPFLLKPFLKIKE